MMKTLGGLIVLVGVITMSIWGVKYVSFKLHKRPELNQTEKKLGFIGLGILLFGYFVGQPTLRTIGEILILLGFVLLITSLVHLIRNKFVTKKPVKKVFKQMGIGAAAVLLLGSVINAPYAEADRKERAVAAKIASEKAESEEKAVAKKLEKEESEAKAKSESEAKKQSEEDKKQAEKKKKESEAKAKSESADKKRAEEESRVKAQQKSESEAQAKIKAEENARVKAAAKQEEARSKVAAEKKPVTRSETQLTDIGGVIVGNVRSRIYHMPGQQNYRMAEKNKVYFNSEQEAIDAGYRRSMR